MKYRIFNVYWTDYPLNIVHVHDLIIHEMLRKKGKATQHNRKTKQHNSPKVKPAQKSSVRESVGSDGTDIPICITPVCSFIVLDQRIVTCVESALISHISLSLSTFTNSVTSLHSLHVA